MKSICISSCAHCHRIAISHSNKDSLELLSERPQRRAADDLLRQDITAEARRRERGDGALRTDITAETKGIRKALTAEFLRRSEGDVFVQETLQTQISSEAKARQQQFDDQHHQVNSLRQESRTLRDGLTSERNDRVAAMIEERVAHQRQIEAEAKARQQQFDDQHRQVNSRTQARLAAEAEARQKAFDDHQQRLDSHVQASLEANSKQEQARSERMRQVESEYDTMAATINALGSATIDKGNINSLAVRLGVTYDAVKRLAYAVDNLRKPMESREGG